MSNIVIVTKDDKFVRVIVDDLSGEIFKVDLLRQTIIPVGGECNSTIVRDVMTENSRRLQSVSGINSLIQCMLEMKEV